MWYATLKLDHTRSIGVFTMPNLAKVYQEQGMSLFNCDVCNKKCVAGYGVSHAICTVCQYITRVNPVPVRMLDTFYKNMVKGDIDSWHSRAKQNP